MLMTYLPRRGLSLFFDAFLLYRDANGKKQRIAPDIVITTMQLEGKQQPPGGAYDLEQSDGCANWKRKYGDCARGTRLTLCSSSGIRVLVKKERRKTYVSIL